LHLSASPPPDCQLGEDLSIAARKTAIGGPAYDLSAITLLMRTSPEDIERMRALNGLAYILAPPTERKFEIADAT